MPGNYQFVRQLALTISCVCAISIGCTGSTITEKEAKEVLHEFYANNEPEPIIDQPLLSAGKPIVPYLIVEIQNKNMPRRGYAILALGKIGDRRALSVLTKILEDRSEVIYFRNDALRAIWHIDPKLGEEYGRKYQLENKEINRTLELLRDEKI